ncbi:MAG: hypothetical protein DRJ01_17355 [Bacteroidetes bacterium]|nr:MAG: hypothetical protein DRJ01_17355 [Bacteroidota bacterium]
MDNNIFEKIFEGKNIRKISSEQCLTDYYKNQGHNIFKSAELAQNNIINFIEFVNLSIRNSKELNVPFIFSFASKNIVEIDNDYFVIKEIKKKLNVLDWKKFEELSSLIIEVCFGCIDTETTQYTADGGLDFEGKIPIKSTSTKKTYGFIEVYGQSKRYSGNVGIYDIKSFVAFANSKKRNYVHPAQLFMFFTSSDFAKNSRKELIDNGFIGLNGFQLSTLIFEHKEQLIEKSKIINDLIE